MATVEQRPLPSARGVVPAAQWTERLYSTLEGHKGRVLATQVVMYFAAAFALASIKPFWFDELITLNIARQQSFHAIWQLLLRAADPNPPLSHLLTSWCMRLFGNGEIAVRIPAIAAGAVTLLCIYVFLVRRIPPIFASVGVFFYMTTHALRL
jgi:4-amino-4-deoxy-L-arabinose transferase-like glycosyltransferase